jgi:FkbH-like protein
MFQLDFGQSKPRSTPNLFHSSISAADIRAVSSSLWEEHCLECAQPECFATCPLYIRRADGNCARFTEGIVQNFRYDGWLGFGAEIKFRRWAKLQSRFSNTTLNPTKARLLTKIDAILSRGSVTIDKFTSSFTRNKHLSLQRYYQFFRRRWHEKSIRKNNDGTSFAYDAFAMETWNQGTDAFSMILEAQIDYQTVFRRSLLLNPGHNLHVIPWREIIAESGTTPARWVLHPESDYEADLVFGCLDAIQFADAGIMNQWISKCPAAKVKCVVWDLDNTLWDGVLADDGTENITLCQRAIDLIRLFDQRGIVQSIASKNDPSLIETFLESQGLKHYFIYEQINWLPKSSNIRKIAEDFNLGLDSFAFIDDSPFEREEVRHHIPEMRIYDAAKIDMLASDPAFDVPITEVSKNRRLSYINESKRKVSRENFPTDYRTFLLDCQLEMSVSSQFAPPSLERCVELLQRTNQLNLSGRRLSRVSLEAEIQSHRHRHYHFSCRDKYGHYGLVGFAAILEDEQYLLMTDFAMSCRIAKKKFENQFFRFLQKSAAKQKKIGILADFVPTKRNNVLLESLKEVGFRMTDPSSSRLLLSCTSVIPDLNLVNFRIEDA